MAELQEKPIVRHFGKVLINVVSAYITDASGKLVYQPERGLDTAISEYAPGRSIVVDKQTYQIGGFFSPGSERRNGQASSPARSYMNDGNYVKSLLTCSCGWFGIHDSSLKTCPFCGNRVELHPRKMLRPWGLAPRDAGPIPEAQLTEEYSIAQQLRRRVLLRGAAAARALRPGGALYCEHAYCISKRAAYHPFESGTVESRFCGL